MTRGGLFDPLLMLGRESRRKEELLTEGRNLMPSWGKSASNFMSLWSESC
jgi:hypothetical protein